MEDERAEKMMEKLNEYLINATPEQLEKDWEELKQYNQFGPEMAEILENAKTRILKQNGLDFKDEVIITLNDEVDFYRERCKRLEKETDYALSEDLNVYPVTIIMDRYGGCYSGALWLAFNDFYYEIPGEVDGSDVECMMYWEEADKSKIGFGSSIQEAYQDLVKKLKQQQ